MSKKLLSALIASLFAAAPAFGQSADDPMRVQGTATARRHPQQHERDRQRPARPVPGPRQRRDVERRRPGAQQHDVVPGLRRELRPRRPVHVPARRRVRRVQVGDIPQRYPAHVLVVRLHAVRRQRRQPADGDVPAGAPADQPADRPAGTPSGWATTAATWAATPSGRRTARGTSGPTRSQVNFSGTRPGSGANGTSPGNGYTDLAIPQDFRTNNWGVEGGYQSGKSTFSVRWDYSQFENSNETLRWTNPFFGPAAPDAQQPARHDVPRAGQHVQQVHARRQLPRPAVAVRGLGALHVGEDDERHAARA